MKAVLRELNDNIQLTVILQRRQSGNSIAETIWHQKDRSYYIFTGGRNLIAD